MARLVRWAPDPEFEVAFDALFPRARRLAQRIVGDKAEAEDIAAEALARTFANWPRVSKLPHRDGWVLKTTIRLAIDRARHRNAVPERIQHSSLEEAATLRLALGAALRALPRRQREVIAMRYLGGMSEAEVAESLGIAAGTVKSHIHRGLVSLRRTLGEEIEEVIS